MILASEINWAAFIPRLMLLFVAVGIVWILTHVYYKVKAKKEKENKK